MSPTPMMLREKRRSVRPPCSVLELDEVDAVTAAGEDVPEGLLGRDDAEIPEERVARPGGDGPDLDGGRRGASGVEAVDDLVNGPVPSEAEDAGDAFLGGLPAELDGVARALGKAHFEPGDLPQKPRLEAAEAFFAPAVAGGGIDDETRSHFRACQPLISPPGQKFNAVRRRLRGRPKNGLISSRSRE